jgi:deazaflavin-dependent oxidoreductase (nitroreductase family)
LHDVRTDQVKGEKEMSGEFTATLEKSGEIENTVTGRVSGKQITLPVWFIEEDGTLYLVPVTGSDTEWYKNVLATPRLQIAAGGQSITAAATPITNQTRVREIVEKFRSKYGADQVAAYYPKTDVAVEVSLPD